MAKATEISVEEKLRQLYALQKADTKIDEIEILKGELPIEVSDLEDEITGLETRLKNLNDTVKDIEKEGQKFLTRISEGEALIKKYTKQLDDVKNNREFDALSKELEMQKLEIQLAEKKARENQEKVNAKTTVIKEVKEKYKSKKANFDLKKDELKSIVAKTEKEEKALRKIAQSAEAVIDARLLNAYHRIRNNYRNGLALVAIERDSCGGCFNQIPPQIQLEVSQRKKIIACEHCGRILVDNEIAGYTVEA
ncbi:MAG TPA: C4-type zinc ribbon domain-containing protein [Saprospiraceae bacterium]|nr:C4-type zinc ribbon domain-containing protein [Saprospiraceae bacterium]